MRQSLIFFLGIFMVNAAHATILAEPGTYELPAIVRLNSKGKPEAVFNLWNRSETKITLNGKVAEKLRLDRPKSLVVKFKIDNKLKSSTAEARLLSFRQLRGQEKLPHHVFNNFALRPRTK